MTPLRGVRGDEGIAPYGWFIEVRLCNGRNTEKPRRDHRDRGGVGTPARARTGGLGLRRLALYPTELQTQMLRRWALDVL